MLKIARLVGAASIASLILGCGEMAGPGGPISKKIAAVIKADKLKEIDLAQLPTFGWDRVHFFRPYTPRAEVCRRLSVPEEVCSSVIREQSEDDGMMTIAFTLNDRVTHAELHSRGNGDFLPLPSGQSVKKVDAIFRIDPQPSPDGRTRALLVQR
jgi:hypothetical protein